MSADTPEEFKSQRVESEWKAYDVVPQQPLVRSTSKMEDILSSDSDENELFKEEQKTSADQPWWKANFFISEPVLFGAWDGVFTSCMLNIFGIIIFLRTGWMVGNAGVGLSILIVCITLTVATIGALSSIGICERCHIESGGVYFLLNHVLGGQVASAVGILYCFGQAVSCSLYTVGFGESISVLLNTTDNPWISRGFAIAVLFLLMTINMAGVKWVIRLQLILLFLILVAAVDFLVGSFISYDELAGVMRYSGKLLQNNTKSEYSNGESFFTVFGVFFPTACGVLAGINMSGDLREPRKAIAQGTIAATALSGSFYVIFVLVLGSVAERWALKTDYMIAEKISAIGILWLVGLYISSITSCMGALYGAPRILQSIASSNSFPRPISYLAIGRGANKVPVVSLAIVAIISLIFICVGDVNFLAPIVTMPFLVTYIAVDYAYFALAMTADLKNAPSSSSKNKSATTPTSIDSNPRGSKSYGSVQQNDASPQGDQSCENDNDEDNDLDHLFPERQYFKNMESGNQVDSSCQPPAPESENNHENANTGQGQKIYQMKTSWYSKLCNRWSSLFGTIGTLVVMFATQWLYSLVSLGTLAVLYVYLVYTIPGANPGLAQFSIIKWIKSKCNRTEDKYVSQIIVNQHQPLLSTAPAQLNDKNEDFCQRKPYHLSQLRSGQELALCCDEPTN